MGGKLHIPARNCNKERWMRSRRQEKNRTGKPTKKTQQTTCGYPKDEEKSPTPNYLVLHGGIGKERWRLDHMKRAASNRPPFEK
ncbi:hypothetical protein DPMN_116684 [Dreissena polymorpha]|uniref:Uncharacterized protein n=1 Tax=Dreissena polymorpha TaxID=45954 RepID=A0A9D4KP94_DREPO|nr:hypothetical protein DPMN_116684 [Dreissena polymorpha]